jgi:hypothetical protein
VHFPATPALCICPSVSSTARDWLQRLPPLALWRLDQRSALPAHVLLKVVTRTRIRCRHLARARVRPHASLVDFDAPNGNPERRHSAGVPFCYSALTHRADDGQHFRALPCSCRAPGCRTSTSLSDLLDFEPGDDRRPAGPTTAQNELSSVRPALCVGRSRSATWLAASPDEFAGTRHLRTGRPPYRP